MRAKRKVFISGPITGNEDTYKAQFEYAAATVERAGDIPLNPAMLPLGLEQRDYMRICIAMLEAADTILQLDGWVESAGAMAENAYAEKIGIRKASMNDFLHETIEPEPQTPISRTERLFGKRETWSMPGANRAAERPDGYRGFLLIRCPECGEIRGFCAKQPITEYTCQNCGEAIPLEDLIPAHVNCGKCGSHFKYMTNIDTDEPVPFQCLECKAPVDLQMNGKGTAITTIGFRRAGGGGTADGSLFRKPAPYWMVR